MLPVTIKNTGNVNITVYFNITNNLTLNKVYRIGTYTVYNGKIANNITLLYNQTATVYVYAYDISSVKLSSSDIIDFHSYYNNTLEHNVTITPEIQSASVNTGSSGISIIDDYTANPAITIYIGIGIIVAAMLVGLIGSSIRSRKKR
jgi:dolichyl-diphosphooligosaccharide--protein glycosyltransferase